MTNETRPHALLLSLLIGLACTRCSTANADGPPPSTGYVDLGRMPEPASAPRIELVGDDGTTLPTFAQAGRVYVLGEAGGRYRIRVVNPTARRMEAVVSVDGVDAVDGRPASLRKRGYIVPAYGETLIDGWRTSLDMVAAFRFSSVRESYAGRKGAARNVGVIGVAFFRERAPAVLANRLPAPSGGAAAEAAPPSAAPQSRAAADEAPPSATRAESGARAPAAARPGLGTQFGEAEASAVEEVEFVRADAAPCRVAELRYDDRAGLLSRGLPVPPPVTARQEENAIRDTAQPFPEARFAQPPR